MSPSQSSERTPWAGMLAAALSRGLPPAAFWRLSIREWRALSREGAGLNRAAFEALAAEHPDR